MPDDLRGAIVREARDWIDTPYLHQGRRKGHGIDCLGLIIGVAKSLNLTRFDARAYKPSPDGKTLKAGCDRLMNQRLNLVPGSVVLMWIQNRNYPQHLAILSDMPNRLGIIHAHQMYGSVREHGLDEFWERRIVQIYDLPGVT